MTDHTVKCPGCPGRRNRSHYLCSSCWRALPADTRGRLARLARRDARAFQRLRELHRALAADTPVASIRVSQ